MGSLGANNANRFGGKNCVILLHKIILKVVKMFLNKVSNTCVTITVGVNNLTVAVSMQNTDI